jgi:hypothetical protein
MRIGLAVLLNSLLILSVPAPLVAKAKIAKITIKGADLKTPIEISDPKTVENFQVWTGPGTSTADKQSLIIDWSHRSVNHPSLFAGIKSRSTQQIRMTESFTWSITRSVPARNRVTYICPAIPMNGPDSMCVRFTAE